VPAQSAKVTALVMLRRASRVRSSSAWTDLNRPAARPEASEPAVWRSTTATDRPDIGAPVDGGPAGRG
jgi:hypothetical protein